MAADSVGDLPRATTRPLYVVLELECDVANLARVISKIKRALTIFLVFCMPLASLLRLLGVVRTATAYKHTRRIVTSR